MKLSAVLMALFTGLLGLFGCSGADVINSFVTHEGYEFHKDIPYGSDPRQHLDVYIPDGLTSPAGVILFFYGGSWKSGKKEDYRFVGQAFASRGYVTVIADYRIYPQVYFPDFVNDAAHALAWVHQHIGEYNGDAKNIFVAGHSAGAHIAIMLATNDHYLKAAGGKPSWIKGAIGLAGPYDDFLSTAEPTIKDIFHRVEDAQAEPTTFVKPGLPPMLLLHGDADNDVSVEHIRRMKSKLDHSRDEAVAKIYPGVGHIGIVLSLAQGFRGKAPTLDDIDDFVRATMATRPN